MQSPEIDWEKYRPEALKARFEFDSDSPDELRLRPTAFLRRFYVFAAGGRACSAGDLPGCTGGILYQPPDHAVTSLTGRMRAASW